MEIPAEINKMNAALADIVANQVDAGRVSCLFIQNLISYHRFSIILRAISNWKSPSDQDTVELKMSHKLIWFIDTLKCFRHNKRLKYLATLSRKSERENRRKKIHLLPQTIKRTRGKSPTETSARIAVSTCKVNCRYTWAVCISWSSLHLGWMNFTSGLMASADKMKQKLRRSN